MGRADEFIKLYNQLSEYLQRVTSSKKYTPFSQLINLAAKKNRFIDKHSHTIKDYGDLRNAILHHSEYPDEIIADPHDSAINNFRKIVESILSPPTLEKFKKCVRCFKPTDPLAKGLSYMRENDFSQIMINTGNDLSLLTVEGIAKWLEKNVGVGIVSISDTNLEDAFACESKNNFKVLSRKQTLFEAQAIFSNAIENQAPRIFAIIITETGKSSEHPLGIITPWDLLTVSEG